MGSPQDRQRDRVLIIEDEPGIVLGLTDAFSFEGFEVLSAATGAGGIALAERAKPHAIVLDLMLPDQNGFSVCEAIRKTSPWVPILMLTARSEESDKIRGFGAGADDYVTKPFSIGELIARIRAIVRRSARAASAPVAPVVLGSASVNLTTHQVTRDGETHQLSYYEVELMRLLHERQGQPVSRDEILDKIWGLEAAPTNRTVDNFIVKLRKKIELTPDKPQYILTVYGFGYKLVLTASDRPPG